MMIRKQAGKDKMISQVSNHYSKLKDLDERLLEWLYKAFILQILGYKFLHIGGLLALPMSVPKLAALFGCSRTPINTWLKKMIDAGYIERRWYREQPRFKDCQIIILTDKGKKYLKSKFRKPTQNLSRGTKKIFSQKILDKKCINENYQSKINNFINNKSIPGANPPGSRTFRRHGESKCALGWTDYEKATGQHQRITARGMQFMHRTMNELAKGLSLTRTEDILAALREYIRHQLSYLKEKTLYNIFNLKAIKIFIKRKWREIYKSEEKAKSSVKEWGRSLFDKYKEKYHLKEVNRPAKGIYQACIDSFNPTEVDNPTILIDNSNKKQTFNEWEEEMYNSKCRKRTREYTEPLFYEGFNLEARRREVLDAYNAQFAKALARPTQKQPKITTQDDLEAAKLRYTRLLKNLV